MEVGKIHALWLSGCARLQPVIISTILPELSWFRSVLPGTDQDTTLHSKRMPSFTLFQILYSLPCDIT